jgi:hypothetical protein
MNWLNSYYKVLSSSPHFSFFTPPSSAPVLLASPPLAFYFLSFSSVQIFLHSILALYLQCPPFRNQIYKDFAPRSSLHSQVSHVHSPHYLRQQALTASRYTRACTRSMPPKVKQRCILSCMRLHYLLNASFIPLSSKKFCPRRQHQCRTVLLPILLT